MRTCIAFLVTLSLGVGISPQMPPAFAQKAPTSAYCKNLLVSMAKKPAKRAMALSRDGKVCTAYWGEASQANADKKAVAGCEEKNERKCSIVRR